MKLFILVFMLLFTLSSCNGFSKKSVKYPRLNKQKIRKTWLLEQRNSTAGNTNNDSSSLTYSCGIPVISSSKIVGGSESEAAGKWPWQTLFWNVDSGGTLRAICGGTLISSKWIITAAHCTEGLKETKIQMELGAHAYTTTESHAKEFAVAKIIDHPGYDSGTLVNDISLIKLAGEAALTDYVIPACLPRQGVDVTVGLDCWITGWGRTQNSAESSEILREAVVPILNNSVCSTWYADKASIGDVHVCAGYEDGKIDTCQGDSGGPLVCREAESEPFTLQGVTSFGIGCAEYQHPGVYTRVSEFVSWIEQSISNNSGDDAFFSITPTACGSIITANQTLRLPVDEKTQLYLPDTLCVWTLRLSEPSTTAVVINFIERFAVEKLYGYCYDLVEVATDTDSFEKTTLCGFEQPSTIRIAPNTHKEITITFSSDRSVEFEGFAINVEFHEADVPYSPVSPSTLAHVSTSSTPPPVYSSSSTLPPCPPSSSPSWHITVPLPYSISSSSPPAHYSSSSLRPPYLSSSKSPPPHSRPPWYSSSSRSPPPHSSSSTSRPPWYSSSSKSPPPHSSSSTSRPPWYSSSSKSPPPHSSSSTSRPPWYSSSSRSPPPHSSNSTSRPPHSSSFSPRPPWYSSSSKSPTPHPSSSSLRPPHSSSSDSPPPYLSSSTSFPCIPSSSTLPPWHSSSISTPPWYLSSAASSVIGYTSKSNSGANGACGTPTITNNRIVGGSEAVAGKWPWQVLFEVTSSDGARSKICGGTLVSNRWVVTAAHCTAGFTARYIHMHLGVFDYDSTESHAKEFPVAKVIDHPGYNDGTFQNDISMIKLAGVVTYSDYVIPACLPSQDVDVSVGLECWATGWGDTEDWSVDQSILREAVVPILANDHCSSLYSSVSSGNPFIYNVHVCAGYEEGGIDTCQGDSGGPLVCRDESSSKFILQGITSFGVGCADAGNPGVYTRVSKFVSWMHTTINNNQDSDAFFSIPQTPCGSVVATNGRLRLPVDSETQMYPNSYVCRWTLQSKGNSINIRFIERFTVEKTYSTCWDYVRITTDDGNVIANQLCGYSLPSDVIVSAGSHTSVEVMFSSDGTVRYEGFAIDVTVGEVGSSGLQLLGETYLIFSLLFLAVLSVFIGFA